MIEDCALIFPAGGSSARYGKKDKLAEMLCSLPVLLHAVKNFGTVIPFENMVIPAGKEHLAEYRALQEQYLPEAGDVCIIEGGASRTESVSRAFHALEKRSFSYAAVHDAARPLGSAELLEKCILAAREHRAAIAAHREVNTLKISDEAGLLGTGNIDRSKLWSVETPQVFEYSLLEKATLRAAEENRLFTDDAAAVEFYFQVRSFPVENKEENLKITLPGQLFLAEFLLNRRNGHA